MTVGSYLSGTAHAALVVWMVVGWGTDVDPLPFDITEVSVVSGEDFAALTRGVQPDLPAGAIEPPAQPVVEESPTPPTPVEESAPEPTPPPAPIETPAQEAPPEAPDLTVPETIVADVPPDAPSTPSIVAPPPSAEIGTSLRPKPRPAPRVVAEPIAPPTPDTPVAPEVTQAATEPAQTPLMRISNARKTTERLKLKRARS